MHQTIAHNKSLNRTPGSVLLSSDNSVAGAGHVHVYCADGEAKFWLEPQIELARNYRLNKVQLKEIESIIEKHIDELQTAWKRHFKS